MILFQNYKLSKNTGDVSSISTLLTNNGFQINNSLEEILEMKFVDGNSFLNHYFIKLGWLQAWNDLLPQWQAKNILQPVEEKLKKEAVQNNGLT